MLENATRGPGRSGGEWLVSKAIDAISQLMVTPALGVKFDDADILERAVASAPCVRVADSIWKDSPRRQMMFTCYVADSDRWLLEEIYRLGDDPSRLEHVTIYPPHQSQQQMWEQKQKKKMWDQKIQKGDDSASESEESEEDACLRGLSYPKTVRPRPPPPDKNRPKSVKHDRHGNYRMIIGVWCLPEIAFQMTLQAVGLLCGLWSGWDWAGLLGNAGSNLR